MFKKKQENITAQESITFNDLKNARLWQIEENNLNDGCIYAINATYQDSIEKEYVGSNRRATFYLNNNKSRPLTLCAVRKEQNKIKFAPFTYSYNQHMQREEKFHGKWTTLEEDEKTEFLTIHEANRLLYYMSELGNSSTIKKLQKSYEKLEKEIKNGNSETQLEKKATALKKFLNFIYNGNANQFMAVMKNSSNEIYQAMIAIRPNTYTISCLTLDYTVSFYYQTRTFGLLSKIKYEPSFIAFEAEYDKQKIKSLSLN